MSPTNRWQRHRGLWGAKLPVEYPRGQSTQKTKLFWRKLNELSKNLDPEFVLGLRCDRLKLDFCFLFKCQFYVYSLFSCIKKRPLPFFYATIFCNSQQFFLRNNSHFNYQMRTTHSNIQVVAPIRIARCSNKQFISKTSRILTLPP